MPKLLRSIFNWLEYREYCSKLPLSQWLDAIEHGEFMLGRHKWIDITQRENEVGVLFTTHGDYSMPSINRAFKLNFDETGICYYAIQTKDGNMSTVYSKGYDRLSSEDGLKQAELKAEELRKMLYKARAKFYVLFLIINDPRLQKD